MLPSIISSNLQKIVTFLMIQGFCVDARLATTHHHHANIELDLLTPIINYKYNIRASLEFPVDKNHWYGHDFTFQIPGVAKNCSVQQWKFCNRLTGLGDNECDCISRVPAGSILIYRFEYVLPNVDKNYKNQNVFARLSGTSIHTKGTIQVVEFTQVPEHAQPGIKICENEYKDLIWNFQPESEVLKKRFQVHTIGWYTLAGGKSRLIAQLVTDKKKHVNIYISEYYKKQASVQPDPKTGFYILRIDGNISARRITVQIRISFNKKIYNACSKIDCSKTVQAKALYLNSSIDEGKNVMMLQSKPAPNETFQLNSSIDEIHLNSSIDEIHLNSFFDEDLGTIFMQNASEGVQETNTSGDIETTQVTSPPPSTTRSSAGTTKITTVVPVLSYRHEENLLYDLIDNVDVVPLRSPTSDMYLSMDIRETVTRSLMVSCSLTKGFMGWPPINLTLWSIDERTSKANQLMTVQGVPRLLHIPFVAIKPIFVCSTDGLAMECVSQDSEVAQSIKTNYTGEEDGKKSVEMRLNHIMYATQTFLILGVILWTIGNIIQHVYLTAWRQRLVVTQMEKSLEQLGITKARPRLGEVELNNLVTSLSEQIQSLAKR